MGLERADKELLQISDSKEILVAHFCALTGAVTTFSSKQNLPRFGHKEGKLVL